MWGFIELNFIEFHLFDRVELKFIEFYLFDRVEFHFSKFKCYILSSCVSF